MGTRGFVILAIVMVGALVFWGGRSSASDRKRITIEVATPDGIVSGSSVIEVRTARAPFWYPVGSQRNSSDYRGEAPFVDLGNGRYLFVALNDQMQQQPITHFLQPQRMEADGSFKPDSTPMLLTFSDIQDAGTISKVEPDLLEAAFGAGYRLERLYVTPTKDQPTSGTLALRFPDLHARLLVPAARRPGLADSSRSDLRNIGWSAFEQPVR